MLNFVVFGGVARQILGKGGEDAAAICLSGRRAKWGRNWIETEQKENKKTLTRVLKTGPIGSYRNYVEIWKKRIRGLKGSAGPLLAIISNRGRDKSSVIRLTFTADS